VKDLTKCEIIKAIEKKCFNTNTILTGNPNELNYSRKLAYVGVLHRKQSKLKTHAYFCLKNIPRYGLGLALATLATLATIMWFPAARNTNSP